MVEPTVAVDGVGAVADPVPPVAVVYQRRFVPVAVSGTGETPWQYTTGDVTPGAPGNAVTFTVIAARGPSHTPVVALTYHVVDPAVAVEGVGAVAEPTPPVAVVYQSKFVPVAVSGTDTAFWQ